MPPLAQLLQACMPYALAAPQCTDDDCSPSVEHRGWRGVAAQGGGLAEAVLWQGMALQHTCQGGLWSSSRVMGP